MYNLYESIELKINNSWISLSNLLSIKEINNINIEKLNIYEDTLAYKLFKYALFYNIDFNELEIRQKVDKIYTEGNKDFNGNRENECIICKQKFKAIRSNIKICNGNHYCDLIDLYSGEIYRKEIMRWNKIEIEEINGKSIYYFYGKYYLNKSHQVSINNMMTILKGTNNICNLTYKDRQDIIKRQKEAGIFALSNDGVSNRNSSYTYEKRCENNSRIARNRVKNGTHNFFFLSENQRKQAYDNALKAKLENGSYSKMMIKRWENEDFRKIMSEKLKERWKDETYRNSMINVAKENWENEEYRNLMISTSKENVDKMTSPGYCTQCGKFNHKRDLIGRGADISGLEISEEIGCNCSYLWYLKHNNSPKMIEISKQNKVKQIEFFKKELEAKLKMISLNIDIKTIFNMKNKQGIIVINNLKLHETNNIYRYLIDNIHKFNKGDKIEIIEGETKLNFNLKKLNIKNIENVENIENLKCISGVWVSNNILHYSNDLYSAIIRNLRTLENLEIWPNITKLEFLLKDNKINFEENIDSKQIIDSFESLEDIPGIWALWGINKATSETQCLTVGQTKNLCKELKWTLRVLSNPNLQELEEQEPGCTGRWDKIQKDYIDYTYILVDKYINDGKERELIELDYAISNNAIYWLPSITQNHLLNNF